MTKEPSGRIFSNALQFYNLAKPSLDDGDLLQKNVMAVVCNLALCVELLLKCTDSGVKKYPPSPDGLISDAEIFSNAWGHDLEKLYNGLDQDIKTKLEKKFHEATGLDLLKNLAECKDYFIHSRYSHEPSSGHPFNISAIQALAEGLKAAIENWRNA